MGVWSILWPRSYRPRANWAWCQCQYVFGMRRILRAWVPDLGVWTVQLRTYHRMSSGIAVSRQPPTAHPPSKFLFHPLLSQPTVGIRILNCQFWPRWAS